MITKTSALALTMAACLALPGGWTPARAETRKSAFPAPAVGYEFDERLASVTDEYPKPVPDPGATAENPLPWRIELFWAEIERQNGVYDLDAAGRLIDRFRAAGHEPIVCLWGGNPLYHDDILSPPTAENAGQVAAWEAFVRAVAREFRGKVRYYEVWRNPNVPGLWPGSEATRQFAFLLKRTSTILRAEGGRSVNVISGGLFGADEPFLRGLFAEGVGPYVDIVALRPDPAGKVGEQTARTAAVLREIAPSTDLWVMGLSAVPGARAPADGGAGEPPRDAVSRAAEARAGIAGIALQSLESFRAGARVVTFDLPVGRQGWPERADAMIRMHALLTPGLGLLPETRATFTAAPGASSGAASGSGGVQAPPPAPVRSLTFFDPAGGIALVGYYPLPDAPAGGEGTPGGNAEEVEVLLSARRPGPPLLYDPVSGTETQPEFTAVAGGATGRVTLADHPLFLLYREGVGQAPAEAIEKGPEEVEVTAERGITAEEIITQHQQIAARQQARLRDYSADGMVQFHFRLGTASQTVDVAMGGRFFYDTSSGAEWEFTDYFVNGNRSPWKKFPELPLIQPEKVVTLPLDISLDRSYTYTLDGEETVEGLDCWILAFDPVDPEKSLYRGRVWIDKKSFNKVRTAVIQTKLESPFISSEERDTYGPVETGDGELWLLQRIDGQQIYTTAGRNFIVLREVDFKDFVVNGPAFEKERQAAYDSDNQMLRDTQEGYRYLVKDEAGNRQVKQGIDKSQLFGLAGVLYDNSRDFPVPLAGVNYFDYDFKGTGLQTNLFFAGVFSSLSVTRPDAGGSGFDIGGEFFGLFVNGKDQEFDRGEKIEARDVDTKSQSLSFTLSHAIGSFVKLRSTTSLERRSFSDSKDTDPHFVTPPDVWETSSELFGSFDRSGYSVNGSVAVVSRSRWPFWGCTESLVKKNGSPRGEFCGIPEPRQDWNPDSQDFMRWQVTAGKEWYLPYFQKVRGEIGWLDGSDLDRFSRYQFGLFGTRLRGFGGSGVRFDEGAIARVGYSFNLGNVVRFDATLDHAHVRELVNGGRYEDHTGIGLAANLLGPWETVIQVDAGYALRSDIPQVQGDAELLLVVLKLF